MVRYLLFFIKYFNIIIHPYTTLKKKRKDVFSDLLFEFCDKKCSNKKRKLDNSFIEQNDTFGDFLKQYYMMNYGLKMICNLNLCKLFK